MKPSSFLPYSPKFGGGWGGGRGGYPGFVSLQVPTSEAAVSADTHAFARLPTGGLRKNRNLRGLGGFCKGSRPLVGRAPSPQAPWRPGPQAPGAWIPPLSPVDFLQAKLVSEGGAVSISAAGPGPKPLGTWPTSP